MIMRLLFLIVLLILSSCDKPKTDFIPVSPQDMVVCGTTEDEDAYKLTEVFFKNKETLTFRLNIVLFTNGECEIDSSFFPQRIEYINNFFKNSDTGIQFELRALSVIKTAPKFTYGIIPFIERVEAINNRGKKFNELRDSFKLEHFKFWNTVYGVQDAINMYVFSEPIGVLAGQAGGYGIPFLGVNINFMSPNYNSDIHELGHVFGLYHTHTFDNTSGLNSYTGDKVCDTPTSPNLLGLVNPNCDLYPNFLNKANEYELDEPSIMVSRLKTMPKESLETIIHNIMGYSYGECRDEFTEQQIKRMRKTIETSIDLRRCVIGMEKMELDFLDNLN